MERAHQASVAIHHQQLVDAVGFHDLYGLDGQRVLLLEKGEPLPRDGSTQDIARVVHAGEFLSREPWQDGTGRRVVPEEHFNIGGKTKWYGAAMLRFDAREFEGLSHDVSIDEKILSELPLRPVAELVEQRTRGVRR